MYILFTIPLTLAMLHSEQPKLKGSGITENIETGFNNFNIRPEFFY